ncbi:MAG TPA: hypothetical protein VJ528_07805 [Geothrix sp.]|nr:hypothetical protein [Geothrix sp.]
MIRPLSKTRIRVAWALALVVDAIQVPADFSGPMGWFLGAGLDLVTMVVMWILVGFHWAFLPSFVTEAVPWLNLAPLWTLAVALATRGRGGEALPQPPASEEAKPPIKVINPGE